MFDIEDFTAWVEGFRGEPPKGSRAKWGAGLVLPSIPIVYGIFICLTQRALIIPKGTLSLLTVSGLTAILFGVAWISGGAFFHFHYFWGNARMLSRVFQPAKGLALIIFVGSFGAFIWRLLAN